MKNNYEIEKMNNFFDSYKDYFVPFKDYKKERDLREKYEKLLIKNKIKYENDEKNKDLDKKEKKITDLFFNECSVEKLTNDHIWPKSKKGIDDKKNIITICNVSNQEKDNKTKKIKINNINFSIISSLNKDKMYIGKIKINNGNLSEERYQFYKKNDLIESEGKDIKKYIIIDTEKYNRYIEKCKSL